MKTIKIALLAATMFIVSGCAVQRYYPAPRVTQANLLAKCPDTLPLLENGKGASILVTMEKWGTQYQTCKEIHNALVDALAADQEHK